MPLSHQHQHALALCVRLDRALQAGEVDLAAWQDEIHQIFDHEVSIHFSAEEKEVFPAAEKFSEMNAVVKELRREHKSLRKMFAGAADRSLDRKELAAFVEALAQHIRKEERQLFEAMQQVMSPDQLAAIGEALHKALQSAVTVCSMRKPPAK